MSPDGPGVWPCRVPGWPEQGPAVQVLAIAHPAPDPSAAASDADGRTAARQRVREVLARYAGPEVVSHLRTSPRQAPLPGPVAVSHSAGLSLLAWCDHGCLGIDLVDLAPVAAMPREEREALATLYLGPEAACDAAHEAEPFAHAWARHEARLKCVGLGLQEWSSEQAAAFSDCLVWPVAWPAPLAEAMQPRVAWLAWRGTAA